MYEKVRVDGCVVSCAVLIAVGIMDDGRRTVLGLSVSLSEAEIHWRTFLQSLKDRGVHGVTFAVSDNHEGLKNMMENLNKQISRRTRVAGLFPNEASLLRLETAILSEISDEWETGKGYLNMKDMPL